MLGERGGHGRTGESSGEARLIQRLGNSALRQARTSLWKCGGASHFHLRRIRHTVGCDMCNSRLLRRVDLLELSANFSRTKFMVSADGPSRPVRLHHMGIQCPWICCTTHELSCLKVILFGISYEISVVPSQQTHIQRILRRSKFCVHRWKSCLRYYHPLRVASYDEYKLRWILYVLICAFLLCLL